jgi:hypothetical protein
MEISRTRSTLILTCALENARPTKNAVIIEKVGRFLPAWHAPVASPLALVATFRMLGYFGESESIGELPSLKGSQHPPLTSLGPRATKSIAQPKHPMILSLTLLLAIP